MRQLSGSKGKKLVQLSTRRRGIISWWRVVPSVRVQTFWIRAGFGRKGYGTVKRSWIRSNQTDWRPGQDTGQNRSAFHSNQIKSVQVEDEVEEALVYYNMV